MDIIPQNTCMPGDPRLIQQVVYELKSQGIFDQFRKECIADVDTKPAYQNLRQRVEGNVITFLKEQVWSPDMVKNQVREQLRKNIHESGYLETGVERIVDQVVNPKINTVLLPKVEEVVYKYLGIEKPTKEVKKEPAVTELLPTDLEAVSPDFVHICKAEEDKKNDNGVTNDSLNDSISSKMDEDESPPFEPLESIGNSHATNMLEENSVDSQLSGFSGLQSHESNHDIDVNTFQNNSRMDWSNQDSMEISHNSSDSRLSVVISEETKMEVFYEPKLTKSNDTVIDVKLENGANIDGDEEIQESASKEDKTKTESDSFKLYEKVLDIEKHVTTSNEKPKDIKKSEEKKSKDRKGDKNKVEDKKARASDKHQDKRDEKYKKDEKHKIGSIEKEKSGLRHSTSSKNRSSSILSALKDKDNEKKDVKDIKHSYDKQKGRNEKDKSKSEKDTDKLKEKYKDKTKSDDKSSKVGTSDKYKKDKKFEKDKEKLFKNKEKVQKEKEKGTKKDKSEKDKERTEKNNDKSKEKDKEKSNKDKLEKHKDKSEHKDEKKDKSSDKRKSSSSSKYAIKDNTKDVKNSSTVQRDSLHSNKRADKSHSITASKSELDSKSKKEKTEKRLDKHSSPKKSKRDSKKEPTDDHYSLKEKKTNRRSFDRDSNDGRSNKSTQSSASLTERPSQSYQSSSSSYSGTGSGDFGNSDASEQVLTESVESKEPILVNNVDVQKVKYIKPKFASNFEEARKIMKIRKQLALLEKQNKLSLTQIDSLGAVVENGLDKDKFKEDKVDSSKEHRNLKINIFRQNLQVVTNSDKENADNQLEKHKNPEKKISLKNLSPLHTTAIDILQPNSIASTLQEDSKIPAEIPALKSAKKTVALQSTNLSQESWEALEARLAQEMAHIDYSSYESHYDDYEDAGCSPVIVSPRKNITLTLDEVKSKDKKDQHNKDTEIKIEENEEKLLDEQKQNNKPDMNKEINKVSTTKHGEKKEVITNVLLSQSKMPLEMSNVGKPIRIEFSPNGNTENVKQEFCVELTEIDALQFEQLKQTNDVAIIEVAGTDTSTEDFSMREHESKANVKTSEKSETVDICRYLEKSGDDVQKRLNFVSTFISKLEKQIQQNVQPTKNNTLFFKRGSKRKLEEHVDFKNNNKAHFEQTVIEVKKKRGRPSKANLGVSNSSKEKCCNSTDIPLNQNFSLPLSPAESEKSFERKEEEMTPQPKSIKRSAAKLQSYCNEDLYKPRPNLGLGSRRSRGAKN